MVTNWGINIEALFGQKVNCHREKVWDNALVGQSVAGDYRRPPIIDEMLPPLDGS